MSLHLLRAGFKRQERLFKYLAANRWALCVQPAVLHPRVSDPRFVPNDLAALVGRRLVTASETNEGSRFNEARVKSLTGNVPITARFLHAEFFTFDPVAKFWLAVNHRPRVTDDTEGFWRRIRLIEFKRRFSKTDDPYLFNTLIAELPGILALGSEARSPGRSVVLSHPSRSSLPPRSTGMTLIPWGSSSTNAV